MSDSSEQGSDQNVAQKAAEHFMTFSRGVHEVLGCLHYIP